jgi:hypothetical protein
MTVAGTLLAVVTLAAAVISGLADLDGAWRRAKAIGQAFKKTLRGSHHVNFAGHPGGRRHPKKTCRVSWKATSAKASTFKKKPVRFGFSELLADVMRGAEPGW